MERARWLGQEAIENEARGSAQGTRHGPSGASPGRQGEQANRLTDDPHRPRARPRYTHRSDGPEKDHCEHGYQFGAKDDHAAAAHAGGGERSAAPCHRRRRRRGRPRRAPPRRPRRRWPCPPPRATYGTARATTPIMLRDPHQRPTRTSGRATVTASAVTRRESTSTSTMAPKAPMRGSAMISRRRVRPTAGSNPSAASARPSRWRQPVTAASTATAITAARAGPASAVAQPPRRADDRADGNPHEREPGERALVRLGGPAEHGQERQRPPHGGGPAGGSASGRPATTR